MWQKRMTWSVACLVIITSLLLASCGGGAAEGEGKVATFIFTQEFDTLNPLYTNMWFSQITNAVWLVWPWQFDEKNVAYPVLVTEMPTVENGGISEDGKVLTFQLRDDVTWSDGEPLTADDFVFSWEMYVAPENTVAATYPYDQIESIEAADDKTVVVTFAETFVPWEASMWHGILPAHVLRSVFEEEGTLDNAEWNLAPTVGIGPYVFEEWESGSFARFVANENWPEQPNIDEIFIRFVPDDAAQINALVAGEGDLGTFFDYSDVATLEEAGVEVFAVDSGYKEGWYYLLGGENLHPALEDVRVRQAIAMGFDRFSIIEDLLLGLTTPAASYWDNSIWVDPTIEPWPYDPDRANELLDDAGWVDTNGDGTRDKDGVELVLDYGSNQRQIRLDLQVVAQEQLAEIGVGLELHNYESDLFFDQEGPAGAGELDIMEWSDTTYYPDPDWYYWLCSEIPTPENPEGANWQRICDEELDALFQLQLTQSDPKERQETFHEISRILYDEVYWLGLFQDPDLWGTNERLQNVKISGVTPFFNIAEWDLADAEE